MVAPEDDRIRTCGELVPVPRRQRTDPDRDPRLERDADLVLDGKYHEHYCDKSWPCPVCAYLDGRRIRGKLAVHFGAWLSAGGSLGILTLGPAHSPDESLAPLWGHLQIGRQATMRGGWTQDKQTYGIAAYAWATEVVETAEGCWNPHCHIALLLARPLGLDQIADLRARTADRFTDAVVKAGGRASAHAQDLKMREGTAGELAHYLTKSHTNIRPLSQRQDGSRTHLEVLADLADTGEGYERWREFTAASAHQQRFRCSNDIADVVAQRGHLLG